MEPIIKVLLSAILVLSNPITRQNGLKPQLREEIKKKKLQKPLKKSTYEMQIHQNLSYVLIRQPYKTKVKIIQIFVITRVLLVVEKVETLYY